MLSILIPIYNYNISKLVSAIHKQATTLNIVFEIICFDDNSTSNTSKNKKVLEALNFSKYIISESNLGRTNARQKLSDAASYNWLLFLDSDTFPKSNNFIKHYIDLLSENYPVIYGGFAYKNEKPDNKSILRWKYGKKFEEVSAYKRNLKPYQIIISGNFIIKKAVFNMINTHLTIKCYGLDNYVGALLQQNQINVFHINNEVYHFGLEKNSCYLKKIEESIITLLWLSKQKKMATHSNKLLYIFVMLKKIKLNYVFLLSYKLFNYSFKKNIISTSPNMYLLQMYKLMYICYMDLKTK